MTFRSTRTIIIELDSDLIDRIQVVGNQDLSFSDFIEKTILYTFESNSCEIPDLWEKRNDLN